MRRLNLVHRPVRLPVAVLATALASALAAIAPRPAVAADSNPPPPGLPPAGDPVVPKRVRMQFQTVVYPGYLEWLGTGLADTVAAFHVFLLTQPMSEGERFAHLQLYIERNR
jgi:hypothetical protein